ncbi:MAG: hypothetical protein ACRDXX_14690 [Stackebrandtia sp.]
MSMPSDPPCAAELKRAHDKLLAAFAELSCAAGKLDPLAWSHSDAEAVAPEQLAQLRAIRDKLKEKTASLASLTGEVGHLHGWIQQVWPEYASLLDQIPRLHPVTEDSAVMKHLVAKADQTSGPAEMIEYLHSLGLYPDGPQWASWTLTRAGGALLWQPCIPSNGEAAQAAEHSEPQPGGADEETQEADDEAPPMPPRLSDRHRTLEIHQAKTEREIRPNDATPPAGIPLPRRVDEPEEAASEQ